MPSFLAECMDDSPTVLLTLDETTGSHIDATGRGNNSTAITVATQGSAAIDSGWAGVNGADDFNGTSSVVTVADNADFWAGAQGDFSIEVVAEPDTVDATFRRVVSHENASTGGWNLSCVTGEGWRLERRNTGTLSSAGNVSAGRTDHVIAVCDVTSVNTASLFMYVNGALANSSTGNAITDNTDPADNLMLGRRCFDATRFFDGRIAHFAFYKSALSSTRVSAHYDARNIPPFIPDVILPSGVT